MRDVNRQSTAAVKWPRSNRNHATTALTSFQPGKLVPIAVMPMLREDSLSGRFNVAVEMLETNELLMNPVNVRLTAYLVPLLALARFEGSRDQFDRSYMGQPKVDGGPVVPFIETLAAGTHGSNEVYKALGLHAKSTDLVNTAYLEAYNTVWNFRARNRSPDITERARLATTLAPAFWHHSRFEHVVPDFDQAVIDGEVALNFTAGNLPLKKAGVAVGVVPVTYRETGATPGARTLTRNATGSAGSPTQVVQAGTALAPLVTEVDLAGIVAEMTTGGTTISLSNLELAKKTQAFARVREQYQELDDEWVIDMLMDGLTIPDQALKQPILLADQMVRIAQAKRFATDADNLAESATSGGAVASMSIRVPKLSTGGVVMIFAEAVPEQLFERQRDPFFHSGNVDAWPEALRDYLDPEKVDVVKNGEIDTDHATPNNTFGYAPMNWKWNAWGPRVGGKFYRPTTNTATDDARKRLWSVETVNPSLAADFYLTTTMHNKPFLDLVVDNFELTIVGNAVINGNTQFGGLLVEATNNYDAVAEKAPTDRIVKA